MSDCRRGFGLDVGFIDHFNTQLVISLNYSAIANLHALNKSLGYTLSLYQPAVSSQWLFLCVHAQVLSEQRLPYISIQISFITFRLGPHRKHRSSVAVQLCPWNVFV
jgi:hypothetical protein